MLRRYRVSMLVELLVNVLVGVARGAWTRAMPWTHEERLPVWPRPRRVSVGSGTAVVQAKAPLFQLAAGGCCKELLEAALRRAERRLSWAQGVEPLPLPHLRVRATGETSIKCNRFCVLTLNAGNASGAGRKEGPFSKVLVEQLGLARRSDLLLLSLLSRLSY